MRRRVVNSLGVLVGVALLGWGSDARADAGPRDGEDQGDGDQVSRATTWDGEEEAGPPAPETGPEGEGAAGEEPDAAEGAAGPEQTAATAGAADGERSAERPAPTGAAFLHRPPATSPPGSELAISGKLQPAWEGERVVLRYRRAPDGIWMEEVMRWSQEGELVGVIPAEAAQPPGLEYYVALLPPKRDGERVDLDRDGLVRPQRLLFGSGKRPHRVLIHGFTRQTLYEKRSAEHGGRLSRVEASYGYSDFGVFKEEVAPEVGNTPSGSATTEPEYRKTDDGNYYHELSLAYTYRFLTYLYAIRMEIGLLAPEFADFNPFGKGDTVGMLYLSPSAEFDFHKYFGASVVVRLAATENGFEGGGGGSARFGRMNGTRLDVGTEGMSYVGWKIFIRFMWDTVPHVPMGVMLERSQWYSHEHWGNRMYFLARWEIAGGFAVNGHVGYAARQRTVQGGLVAGGGLSLDF